MQWKQNLIARVDARVHAAPIALPADTSLAMPATQEPAKDTKAAPHALEYLRVKVAGTYVPAATSLVRAATELGTGYWVMTPIRMDDGRQVWINRGYIPSGVVAKDAAAVTPTGPVEVTGLLRASEVGGSVLQANRPQDGRWYSRDVMAMAQDRGIGVVVPVFVDAQIETGTPVPNATLKPVAGLTQISFADNHFMYALTWFGLAGLSIFGLVLVWRRA